MTEILSNGFRVTAIFLIIFFGTVFYESEKVSYRKNVFIFFLLTVIGYLLAYWEPFQSNKLIFTISFFLSITLPFAFWLAAKALFNDDFKWSAKYWILSIGVPVILNVLYYSNEVITDGFYIQIRVLPYLISVFFILLVIYESIKNRDNDLVLSRLKKRNVFVIFSSFMALFSIYFFFVEDPMKLPALFDLFQNGVICIFIALFFYPQIEYKNLWEVTRSHGVTNDANTIIQKRIIEKIRQLFENERMYTSEGITITQLSENISEKEYQVRRAINGELGYTNFNAFLNYYRIREACRIIGSDHNKSLTFQEIAFKMGYQSVATFNRAFKTETGKTPSEYSDNLN